jgi:hypothetical protein
MVPKEHVAGFDGAEVTLNLTVNELARFALWWWTLKLLVFIVQVVVAYMTTVSNNSCSSVFLNAISFFKRLNRRPFADS